jgi:hypothetical protein
MNFFVFKPPYTEFPEIDLREKNNEYEFYISGEEYVDTPIYIETPKLQLRNGIVKMGTEEFADLILDELLASFLKELCETLIERVVALRQKLSYRQTVEYTKSIIVRHCGVKYLRANIRDVFIYGGKDEIPMKKTELKNQSVRAILGVHSFCQKDDFFYFNIELKQIYVYEDF